jgi:hypothetical protein
MAKFNIQATVNMVSLSFTWGDIVPKSVLDTFFGTVMPATGKPEEILSIHRTYNRRAGELKREMIRQHKMMLIATTKPAIPGYRIVKSNKQQVEAAAHYKKKTKLEMTKLNDRMVNVKTANLTKNEQTTANSNITKTAAMLNAIDNAMTAWGM